MDLGKVKIIQDWPEPKKVKDIQSFLGFANFYRCYIHNYSNIVVPLTHLMQKDTLWDFLDTCCLSFSLLKNAFTIALVLTHWRPDLPIIVKTDASDYALAAILSIQEANGDIHPVAFHSQTFLVDVATDHKNLKYFSTTKILSQHQAHWSEFLSGFNMVIHFHPGHLSTKPNVLTRHPDLYLKEGGKDFGKVNPSNFKPIFSSEILSKSL